MLVVITISASLQGGTQTLEAKVGAALADATKQFFPQVFPPILTDAMVNVSSLKGDSG